MSHPNALLLAECILAQNNLLQHLFLRGYEYHYDLRATNPKRASKHLTDMRMLSDYPHSAAFLIDPGDNVFEIVLGERDVLLETYVSPERIRLNSLAHLRAYLSRHPGKRKTADPDYHAEVRYDPTPAATPVGSRGSAMSNAVWYEAGGVSSTASFATGTVPTARGYADIGGAMANGSWTISSSSVDDIAP